MQIQQVLSMVMNVTHGMWMLLSMVLIFKTDTGMYTYCVCLRRLFRDFTEFLFSLKLPTLKKK